MGLILFVHIVYSTNEGALFTEYVAQVNTLIIVAFLVWRAETLPRLSPLPLPVREGSEYSQGQEQAEGLSAPLPHREGPGESLLGESLLGSHSEIEQLLSEHCVATQLYLQHDLTLQQLAQAIGTNRSYLSQYFSRQGITYNIYINNLRINHFISRCQELSAAGKSIVAQQLASESGYRSYSTFSLAFKQRTGQSITAWKNGRGVIL